MRLGFKFNPRILLSLLFGGIALYAFLAAMQWNTATRLFPQMAAAAVLIFAVTQIIKDGWTSAKPGARVMDFQFAEGLPPDLVRRRMIIIWAWLIGLPLAIWLVGFSIAVPGVMFAYLKFQGRESWAMSIAFAAAAYLFYWGVFQNILHIPVPQPLLFRLF